MLLYDNLDIGPNEWGREGFAGSGICELPVDEAGGIKREHCSQLSVQRFIDEYERPYKPVVIDGVPEAEGWGALKNWSLKVSSEARRAVKVSSG